MPLLTLFKRRKRPETWKIASELYLAYLRHCGFPAPTNNNPPVGTFVWAQAEAITKLLDGS